MSHLKKASFTFDHGQMEGPLSQKREQPKPIQPGLKSQPIPATRGRRSSCSFVRKHSLLRRKSMGECVGCEKQTSIKEMHVFSTSCFHSICQGCLDSNIYKKLSQGEQIKCPEHYCQRILEESSMIYLNYSSKETGTTIYSKHPSSRPSEDKIMEDFSNKIPEPEKPRSGLQATLQRIGKRLSQKEITYNKNKSNYEKKNIEFDLDLPEESRYPQKFIKEAIKKREELETVGPKIHKNGSIYELTPLNQGLSYRQLDPEKSDLDIQHISIAKKPVSSRIIRLRQEKEL